MGRKRESDTILATIFMVLAIACLIAFIIVWWKYGSFDDHYSVGAGQDAHLVERKNPYGLWWFVTGIGSIVLCCISANIKEDLLGSFIEKKANEYIENQKKI